MARSFFLPLLALACGEAPETIPAEFASVRVTPRDPLADTRRLDCDAGVSRDGGGDASFERPAVHDALESLAVEQPAGVEQPTLGRPTDAVRQAVVYGDIVGNPPRRCTFVR